MIVNNKKKIPEQTGIDSDFNPEIKDILSQKYSPKEETHKKYESECLRILKEYVLDSFNEEIAGLYENE